VFFPKRTKRPVREGEVILADRSDDTTHGEPSPSLRSSLLSSLRSSLLSSLLSSLRSFILYIFVNLTKQVIIWRCRLVMSIVSSLLTFYRLIMNTFNIICWGRYQNLMFYWMKRWMCEWITNKCNESCYFALKYFRAESISRSRDGSIDTYHHRCWQSINQKAKRYFLWFAAFFVVSYDQCDDVTLGFMGNYSCSFKRLKHLCYL